MEQKSKKGRVTGLGGFFITSENPDKLKKWFEKNLGLPCDQYGHLFKWRLPDDPEKIGHTQFSVFEKGSAYLKPGTKDYMINFRVNDVKAIIEDFKRKGLQVAGEIEEYEYGKFGWVIDPEGNKIELWEPVDEIFTNDEAGNNDSTDQ